MRTVVTAISPRDACAYRLGQLARAAESLLGVLEMAPDLGAAGHHVGASGVIALKMMLRAEKERVEVAGDGVTAEDRSTLLPAVTEALAALDRCDGETPGAQCLDQVRAARNAIEYHQRLVG